MELPKNFRHQVKPKSKKWAKSFFLSRKKKIEKSVEQLYGEHKSKIAKKILALEKQKKFKTEVELRFVSYFLTPELKFNSPCYRNKA
jgi:hypothetical protein